MTALRSLGFGYCAEYIQQTAKILVETHGASIPSGQSGEGAEVWLSSFRNLDVDTAWSELLKFTGVGRKVADCVLLMSLDKVRTDFPILRHCEN